MVILENVEKSNGLTSIAWASGPTDLSYAQTRTSREDSVAISTVVLDLPHEALPHASLAQTEGFDRIVPFLDDGGQRRQALIEVFGVEGKLAPVQDLSLGSTGVIRRTGNDFDAVFSRRR